VRRMPGAPEEPAHAGSEREMLARFLDYQREVMVRKVTGVSDENLRRPMTESNVTLLGILKHLAYVERYWFRRVFGNEDAGLPWSDGDPDADWRVGPGETTESIVALYRAESEMSHRIAATAELDAVAAAPAMSYTMRWILFHMIEETARHLGHADILRERIDGTVGN
jgi:uncharacterized damage-inducible protein DinB